MLLIIDNYDSFTYNIARYFVELGETVQVEQNDALTLNDIKQLNPSRIVISPGPCTPNEAGISTAVIKAFAGIIPILGVCLGHQCIAQVFGGRIINAQALMHGKTSDIYHNSLNVFSNLPNPFTATRYHSLVVAPKYLPACLTMTAWTQTDEGKPIDMMGLAHKEYPLFGVQFHPESILSDHGHALFQNFLKL